MNKVQNLSNSEPTYFCYHSGFLRGHTHFLTVDKHVKIHDVLNLQHLPLSYQLLPNLHAYTDTANLFVNRQPDAVLISLTLWFTRQTAVMCSETSSPAITGDIIRHHFHGKLVTTSWGRLGSVEVGYVTWRNSSPPRCHGSLTYWLK
jgi:hypothetical protein